MLKFVIAALFQVILASGFAQSYSLQNLGQPFHSTNLDVRWKAPTNAWPSTVWVYQLTSKPFPPQVASNLLSICGLSEKDRKSFNGQQVIYKDRDSFPDKQLGIGSSSVFYITVSHYGPTNLAVDVPGMADMPRLTTNFLTKLGIPVWEVEKSTNGGPNFHFWEPLREYYVGGKTITNVEFRAVDFRRSVDGAAVLGVGAAGDGQIEFGPRGVPVKIDISWPGLERHKSYPAATPETVINWIRSGRAVQGMLSTDSEGINWATVKILTITKAQFCYYAGDRFNHSPWLMPIASLWTTIDTGHGSIDVEIDCPLVDL
jgi:hypothetical protein